MGIIQYCSFSCLNYFRFGHWELFQLVSELFLTNSITMGFFLLFHFLKNMFYNEKGPPLCPKLNWTHNPPPLAPWVLESCNVTPHLASFSIWVLSFFWHYKILQSYSTNLILTFTQFFFFFFIREGIWRQDLGTGSLLFRASQYDTGRK